MRLEGGPDRERTCHCRHCTDGKTSAVRLPAHSLSVVRHIGRGEGVRECWCEVFDVCCQGVVCMHLQQTAQRRPCDWPEGLVILWNFGRKAMQGGLAACEPETTGGVSRGCRRTAKRKRNDAASERRNSTMPPAA